MGSLTTRTLEQPSASELARRSAAWSQPVGTGAALTVAVPSDDAVVLGAFQRAGDAADAGLPVLRRGSGGGAARVGPGTVWVQLSLERPGALVACTADKLLNRYVRPLLAALTRSLQVPASYFGRDWVSASSRPVALVGFAHEAATGRALFEALVAVRTPLTTGPRASFRGKPAATLEEVAGRPLDVDAVARAIVAAYGALAGSVEEIADRRAPHVEPPLAPGLAWAATREEAIGTVAAGRDESGRLRIGGELMASGDALARLEELVSALPPDASSDAVGRLVDESLASSGAVTFGVRSLSSIRDVVLEALRRQ